jgi:hypothetical protein
MISRLLASRYYFTESAKQVSQGLHSDSVLTTYSYVTEFVYALYNTFNVLEGIMS